MKNHQRYNIDYVMSPSGKIIFKITDIWGQERSTDTVLFSGLRAEELLLFEEMTHGDRCVFMLAKLQQAFKNPFRVHVETIKNQIIIRIGKYGLAGGSPQDGIPAQISMLKMATGVGLLCTGGGVIPGATLLAAGMSEFAYLIKCDGPEEEFSWKRFATHGFVGAAGAAASGAATAVLGSGIVAATASGASAAVVSEVTDHKLHQEQRQKEGRGNLDIGTALLVGGAAGLGGSTAKELAGSITGEALSALFNAADDSVAAAITTGAMGGASGSVSAKVIAKVTANLVKGAHPTKNLTRAEIAFAAAQGGTLGAIINGSQQIQKNQTEQERIDALRKYKSAAAEGEKGWTEEQAPLEAQYSEARAQYRQLREQLINKYQKLIDDKRIIKGDGIDHHLSAEEAAEQAMLGKHLLIKQKGPCIFKSRHRQHQDNQPVAKKFASAEAKVEEARDQCFPPYTPRPKTQAELAAWEKYLNASEQAFADRLAYEETTIRPDVTPPAQQPPRPRSPVDDSQSETDEPEPAPRVVRAPVPLAAIAPPPTPELQREEQQQQRQYRENAEALQQVQRRTPRYRLRRPTEPSLYDFIKPKLEKIKKEKK